MTCAQVFGIQHMPQWNRTSLSWAIFLQTFKIEMHLPNNRISLWKKKSLNQWSKCKSDILFARYFKRTFFGALLCIKDNCLFYGDREHQKSVRNFDLFQQPARDALGVCLRRRPAARSINFPRLLWYCPARVS